MASVQQVLVIGIGMDKGDCGLLHSKGIIQHFGHRRQHIGCAAAAADDAMAGRVELLLVDSHTYGYVSMIGGAGHDYFVANYRWPVIEAKYESILQAVAS